MYITQYKCYIYSERFYIIITFERLFGTGFSEITDVRIFVKWKNGNHLTFNSKGEYSGIKIQ